LLLLEVGLVADGGQEEAGVVVVTAPQRELLEVVHPQNQH
jgi:hypothetical protein